MDIMKSELEMMQMTLNPKKVEYLDANHWFKFLGYSIKGHNISLSSTRIKTFQKEIEKRTIKKRDTTMTKAINAVNRYLYKGYCDYSWATQVLPVINVKEDIDKLNAFVMDCIRAVKTGKRKVLAFTKMFDLCNEYLDEGNVIPENMHILFSGWLGLKMDNRHGFPEAHPIFESGTSAPEGTLLCTGNCTECLKEDRLCWYIGKGQAIGFLAH